MLQGEDCRCNVRPRGSAAAEGASLVTMSWLVLLLAWIMSQGASLPLHLVITAYFQNTVRNKFVSNYPTEVNFDTSKLPKRGVILV